MSRKWKCLCLPRPTTQFHADQSSHQPLPGFYLLAASRRIDWGEWGIGDLDSIIFLEPTSFVSGSPTAFTPQGVNVDPNRIAFFLTCRVITFPRRLSFKEVTVRAVIAVVRVVIPVIGFIWITPSDRSASSGFCVRTTARDSFVRLVDPFKETRSFVPSVQWQWG